MVLGYKHYNYLKKQTKVNSEHLILKCSMLKYTITSEPLDDQDFVSNMPLLISWSRSIFNFFSTCNSKLLFELKPHINTNSAYRCRCNHSIEIEPTPKLRY